ncbi:hypothetical protein AJ80_08279 [Polytolypa hystricis UAMH7299]|uniref:Polarized growth protein n=1 Tax=Polytolypa hystricis (strain UAMH7299) TaxID=1447883 RepID=A0A2B7XAN8_POLH7|nr:hypothetical protein AJ80_08279 [Polytolypa hystricis UAMH7299]
MAHLPELPRNVHPGDVLAVVHDFEARGADELTLRRGDKIELLELDGGFGDGWYLGKNLAEKTIGLFPGVYTTSTPKISVRQPASPSISSDVSGNEDRNESSEPTTQLEATHDSVSHVSNDDITPQASRHVSASDIKPPVITEDDDNIRPTSSQQHSRQSTLSSAAPLSPGIQRSISETIESHKAGEDSLVMNETLSVIDEHITNFSTPRHSYISPERNAERNANDSGSEYSSHIDHRHSYIPGTETDEEEDSGLTEAVVKGWDPKQTSHHLRQIGVDPRHCDIFEEQEITGDVVLEMDQEFLFMKDFNFGVMGRRLKTWHTIKTFQEEVKGIKQSRQSTSTSTYSPRNGSVEEFDRSQSRMGTGSFLPRIPSHSQPTSRQSRAVSFTKTHVGPSGSIPSVLSNATSPVSPLSQPGRDDFSRPSAASIRQINHSRRHSSMDSSSISPVLDGRLTSIAPGTAHTSREKKTSFDRGWTMSSASQAINRPTDDHHVVSTKSSLIADSVADVERGYFSGGELDSRRSRNVLKKRDSEGRSFSHSRQSSTADNVNQSRTKRQSRFGSADSIRDLVPHISSASKAYHSGSVRGKFGGLNDRAHDSFGDQVHSPTVTNLEQSPSRSHGLFSALSPLYSKADGESSGRSSPLPSTHLKNVAPKVRRAIGLRAISDAVTGNEKALVSSPTSLSPKDFPQSPTRTNSSTPSGTSKSFEMESTDGSSTNVEGAFALVTMPKSSPNVRTKSKKATSAYIRGLEKKTPQEQMIGCDYCGWMKKKSSNLMTTWKPRLFVLRGRRLSYYYSENDTEERGLIDISSHRVFRADQDTITSLHATITGAKASPTSPTVFTNPNNSGNDSTDTSIPKTGGDASFIFKLVPPKAGLSRAVQFTKPSVHFFQVDNIQQGRLWMAALMKATIERDLNLPVRTTNKQKTVSLKQARNMNQRPPALMGAGNTDNPSEQKPTANENGASSDGQNDKLSNGNESGSSDFQKLGDFDIGPPPYDPTLGSSRE